MATKVAWIESCWEPQDSMGSRSLSSSPMPTRSILLLISNPTRRCCCRRRYEIPTMEEWRANYLYPRKASLLTWPTRHSTLTMQQLFAIRCPSRSEHHPHSLVVILHPSFQPSVKQSIWTAELSLSIWAAAAVVLAVSIASPAEVVDLVLVAVVC